MLSKRFLLGLTVVLICHRTQSALVINEVCYDNSVVGDENGNTSSDWIELYNNGSDGINVNGYALSGKNPYQDAEGVRLPNYTIPPGGYLVVFANSTLAEYTAWTIEQVPVVHGQFDLNNQGQNVHLLNASGIRIYRFDMPATEPGQNKSYGAFPDGSISFFKLFDKPTPQLPASYLPLTGVHITQQPTNQIVLAGAGLLFSVNAITASSLDPIYYQWYRDNKTLPGSTNATLTLGSVSVSDSGRYSVRISNAYASINSASAKLTVLGGAQYSQDVCRMPDPVPFEKLQGQDSLIVITHGWQPLGEFADLSWMDQMADAIRANLACQGKTNWLVKTYKWPSHAQPLPEDTLRNGKTLGVFLGAMIGAQSWEHVHLIGHSAGAALVQTATEMIKYVSEDTAVHATFLDPYTGIYTQERQHYGQQADFAENYFSDDWTGSLTGARLPHTHNVNVTQLDPDYTGGLLCFYSGSTMPASIPAIASAESSHPYPHDFYLSTIELRCSPEAGGYGFPLSKEGGGWDNRTAYANNNEPIMLGAPAVCLPNTVIDVTMGTAFDLNSLTRATSDTGVTVLSGALQLSCEQSTLNGLSMTSMSQGVNSLSETASAAWISVAVTVTDVVNFVTFDISFASPANAQGLLTAYWETNVVGTVDERTVMAVPESYRFPLPENYSAGTYALGFRLDSFTNITSRVTVTNVAAGFAGNTAPISLDVAATTNGMFMTLSALAQHNYLVQASTNLVDWSPFAILANTNGAVRFYDPDRSKHKQRFYRAVCP